MQNSLNDDSADDAELLDAYTRDALLHWDSADDAEERDDAADDAENEMMPTSLYDAELNGKPDDAAADAAADAAEELLDADGRDADRQPPLGFRR